MRTFRFSITQTDVYKHFYQVEAETQAEALALAEKEFSEGLDGHNALENSDINFAPIPACESIESLFNPDEDNQEDDLVILVSDLSEEQKQYLGLQ